MSETPRAPTVRDRDHHEVTLSVSLVQAVEPPEREPPFHESVRDGQRKRIYESLHPEHHFHVEYRLLPEAVGGRVYHTDVVTFGVASKVYTEQDVRVVKFWEEGELEGGRLMHFGWRHRHTFKVTRSLLLELYDHIVEVRVWNTKDKLSARARYDRPKALRLPAPSKNPQHVGEGDLGNDDMATNGRPARLPVVSQELGSKSRRGRRGERRSTLSVAESDSDDLNTSIGEVGSALVPPRKAPTIVEEEEGKVGGASSLSVALVPHPSHAPASLCMEVATTQPSASLQGLSRRKAKRLEAEAAEAARIAREGMVVLRLRMSDLFAKQTSISVKLQEAVKNLKGFEVGVSLEGPLMPDRLLRELNPMTITVNHAVGLPSTPVPHEELRERCEPVYVRYCFLSQPWHRTVSLPHSPHISWEDSHVILLGTLDQQRLVEYLHGPPLVMEVHDRDCRQGDPSLPSLFGREERDEVLGTCAFATGFLRRSCGRRSQDPYGVACVDLSGLLAGQRMVEVTTPITRGEWRGEGEEGEGVRVGPLRRALPAPLPPGDYIQSQSELTVTVELTHPLTPSPPSPSHTSHSTPTKTPLQQHTPNTCPFNRLVYVISSEGTPLVKRILKLVNEINTEALGLQDLPKDVLPAALSTYKLTKDQMCSVECDVVTGFHVEDWEQHVVVLEGVRGGGVRRVWEELPRHPTQAEALLKVFYNSEFAFSQRLYGSLDIDLPRILLHQPLSQLVQRSMLYVRGSVSQMCFHTLICLSELALVSEMADLTRNDLFPTAEAIASLGLQFGMPPEFDMEEEHTLSSLECSLNRPHPPPLEERYCRRRGSQPVWEPLEMSNPVFERALRERESRPSQDFVRKNILHSQALSERSSQRKGEGRRARSLSEGALSHTTQLEAPAHNYSTQALNSTELAKSVLREKLATDPAHHYTYCQHYHSMTVVPIDVEAEQRARRLEARQKWRTKEGFIYPGVPTAAESNSHPKKPDPACSEDLKEPFEDNLLHANTLKPTVERLHFSWQRRSEDFERWRPPPTSLGPPPPITIHLAGESHLRELRESLEREREEWKEKLVVDDTHFHVHRKGVATELHMSGPKASTQLDKLNGLLKDAPQKYNLQKEGLRLDSIPPLDMMHNNSVDSRLGAPCTEREEGTVYLPGPSNKRSWKLDSNVIPVRGQRGNKWGERTQGKLHTQDFRLYYHTPSVNSKRPILPLREDEKTLPLFARPPPPLAQS